MTKTGRTAADAAGVRYGGRRAIFFVLVTATWAAAVVTMIHLLAHDGLAWSEMAMAGCFALSIPMVVIGFWNAVLGTGILLLAPDPLRLVAPFAARTARGRRARVAIVMPVYNEAPERVFRHLQKVVASLDKLGAGDDYEVFLLSDSTDPAIRVEEQRRFDSWRRLDPRPERLHERHRPRNVGFKAGNVWEFVQQRGDDFDYMVVLDADSVMTGQAVDRLIRIMEGNPRIGILQSLAVGLPSDSLFARVFMFGMRHGMLTHTVGAAWWQGDAGPYWGHNAAIRLAPFKRACALPVLPGSPPLGGHILSHDQVEAALMRAHGYEVRVLPVEQGSYEEMPPTLPDFIKRDLRWCQGNMQYLGLLGRAGFRPMGRVQLALAVLMYAGAPFWLLFVLLGLTQVVAGAPFGPTLHLGEVLGTPGLGTGIGLFAAMIGMTFAPKVMGYAHALLDSRRRQSYGGGRRVLLGGLVEVLFSALLGPVMMVAQSVFMGGLLFGRTVRWEAQQRDGHRVGLGDALRGLWPQTLLGLAGTALLVAWAPALLPWAAPLLVSLILAAPFAWATALPTLGQGCVRLRLCATPEERAVGRLDLLQVEGAAARGGGPMLPAEARGSRVE